MANINVVNLGGKKVGEFELADEVFAGEINDGLLRESVKHYRNVEVPLVIFTASLNIQRIAGRIERKPGSSRAQEAARVTIQEKRSRRISPI